MEHLAPSSLYVRRGFSVGSTGALRSASAPRDRRRFERFTESLVECLLQREAIECDTQMASHVDTTACRIEECRGEEDRLADAGTEREVQLPDKGEPYERPIGDPSPDPTPSAADFRYGVLGQDVVDPFLRSVEGK